SSALSVPLACARELLHDLVDAEARGPLARWKLLEARDPFRHKALGGHEEKDPPSQPVVVVDGVVVRPLERIAPEVEELRDAQIDHGLRPDLEALSALLLEDSLPVLVAKRHEVAVVTPVEHLLSGRLLDLALEQWQEVVAVEVRLERRAARLVPRE